VTAEALLGAATLLSGLLAGHELATLVSVGSARRGLPLSARIHADQALTRRRAAVMPLFLALSLVAALAAAVALAGHHAFDFAAGAAAALGAMVALTLVRGVPLNRRTLAFPPDGDEREWAEIRRRWDRRHALRVALDVAAFGSLIAALAVG
jgi:uncharacterized membrane protein